MRVRHALAAFAVAAVTVPLAAAAAPTPVPGQGHVQNIGWMPTSTTIIGTTGKALRLEAVKLTGRLGLGLPDQLFLRFNTGERTLLLVFEEGEEEYDVSAYPHQIEGSEFRTVGEIFSAEKNPDRKKPFDIRTVIAAVCDADHPRVERWAGMADAETAVVMDARMGGHSVCVLGIESKPVVRAGFPPTDGPDTYAGGTLFPRSSKKVARAINAASGNRPLVEAICRHGAEVFGEAPDGAVDPLAPEHVVRLVNFLASDDAEKVSGQVFVVYGPQVMLMAPPTVEEVFAADGDAWDADDLAKTLGEHFADRDPGRIFSALDLIK